MKTKLIKYFRLEFLIFLSLFLAPIFSPTAPLNNWIVEMRRPLTGKEIRNFELHWKATIQLLDKYPSSYFRRTYLVKTSASRTQILNEPNTVRVEKDDSIEPLTIKKPDFVSTLANDSFTNYQWAIENRGQIILRDRFDTDLVSVPYFGKTGADLDFKLIKTIDSKLKRDVVVAVIDSGLDIDHPDISQNVYVNETECPNGIIPILNPKDLDGNGYAGDCKGWNFTDQLSPNRVYDFGGHGTHVAGIISAVNNNNFGITGLSNRIKILPIKIFGSKPKNENSESSIEQEVDSLTSVIAKAINYAVIMKVDVINMSFGWPAAFEKEFIKEAVNNAIKNGIMIVAAAGNNGNFAPLLPCSKKGVLCVGAFTNDGTIANYSNYGMDIDVVAPGDNILSLSPSSISTPSFFATVGFEVKSGTSQAAPFVSGLAALLKGIDPKKSPNEIFDLIRLGSRPLLVEDSKKEFLTGAVSFDNALLGNFKYRVLPSFKELNFLKFSLDKKNIFYKFPVRNPSSKQVTTQLTIKSQSPGLKILKPNLRLELRPHEEKPVEIPILIENNQINYNVTLEINIDGHVYRPHLNLVRNIESDLQLENYKIEGVEPLTFRSIQARHLQPDSPQYYSKSIDLKKKELTIEVAKLQGASFKKIGEYKLQQFYSLISFKLSDLDHDGKLEYQLIVTHGKNSPERLVYYNFDQEFKLINEIEAYAEAAIQTESQLGYLYQDFEGKPFARPIFPSFSRTPRLDQPLNPGIPRISDYGSHAYYFEPVRLPNRKIIYVNRLLIKTEWIEEIKNLMGLTSPDDIRVTAVLPQSDEDLKLNRVFLLCSYGYDFDRKPALLSVFINDKGQKKYDWKPFDAKGYVFDRKEFLPILNLGNLLYNGFATVFRLDYANWDLANYDLDTGSSSVSRVVAGDYDERLNVYIQLYKVDSTRFAFYQTTGKHMLMVENGSEIKKFSEPVHVSTFLPGQAFLDRGFPIWHYREGKITPAVYVDSSDILYRTVHVLSGTKDGLLSPARLSLFVPQNCETLTPSVWNQKTYKFSMVCKNADNSWSLKFLPLDI